MNDEQESARSYAVHCKNCDGTRVTITCSECDTVETVDAIPIDASRITIAVDDAVMEAIHLAKIIYIPEGSYPWIVNARDKRDGPPYEIWHTGGPGGRIGAFDRLKDAILCEAASEIVATLRTAAVQSIADVRREALEDVLCALEAAGVDPGVFPDEGMTAAFGIVRRMIHEISGTKEQQP